MEIRLKIIIPYVFAFLICNFSCSISRNDPFMLNNEIEKFKKYYVASLFSELYYQNNDDKDIVPCSLPDDLDKLAIKQIDSLTKESINNLWKRSDEGREFIGHREWYKLDFLCVTDESLRVYHSKELNLLATAYAKRKLKESKRLKKKAR